MGACRCGDCCPAPRLGVLVPLNQLAPAIQVLKAVGGTVGFNSFGGIKFQWSEPDWAHPLDLDLWSSSLDDYLLNARAGVAGAHVYRPFGGLVLRIGQA